MPSRPERALCIVLLIAPFWLGCGARYVRTSVHSTDLVQVVLRAEIRSGEPVARHFSHPATISGIRLAHILSRLDVRLDVEDEGGARKPAIDTSLLYPLGDLLSEALAKADANQEIVVQATRKEKNLGVFHKEFLTSFIAYVGADDLLYIHLSRVDWPVPKGDRDTIKEPTVGREVMSFRALPGPSIENAGPQGVAVEWRDPVFRKATNIRVGPTGKVSRRTILMESGEEAAADAPEALPPETIPSDPDALRALAELEEARTAGQITESEYRRQRKTILRGQAP